jgi:hypothetical protein
MVSILKKTLKAISWLAIGILFLLVVLAILIRLPSVQKKITGYAVSYVTGKTHTAVRVGEIAIAFPKSVSIKELFIGDQQNDTLLSAETIKINLCFRDLLKKNIHINSLSVQGATIHLNRTVTDSLFNFNFLLTAFADPEKDQKASKDSVSAWKYAIDDITLQDVRLDYDDAYGDLKISALLENLKLKMDRIDPAGSVFGINDLQISGSSVTYQDNGNQHNFRAGINSVRVKNAALELQDDWKITAESIGMADNSIEYESGDSIEFSNYFNANHLDFKDITLDISDLFFTDAKKSISVRNFSAVDQNNFTIKKFATEFSMDLHSITASLLLAETANSSIEGDFKFGFSSLQALADSIPNMDLTLDIRNARIMHSDIIYFNSELASQSFFTNPGLITEFSGNLSGSVDNLTGKDLVVKTGTNTTLETDCKMVGLPDFETMQADFPNLKISSGSKDIRMMAGKYIPENIDLPASITANITFTGMLKSFVADLNVTSSFGNASVSASVDKLENFKAKAGLSQFDLGKLLKNDKMFGPVTALAVISGKGLDKNTVRAELNGEIASIRLNAYDYHHLTLEGNLTGQEFDGTIQLKDENATFDFTGLVNLTPGQEQYKFRLNLEGADLEQLNLSKTGLAVGLVATVDLKGGSLNKITGTAAIRNMVIIHDGKKYALDSLTVASINGPEKNEVSVGSAIIDVRFAGAVSLVALPSALGRYLNGYFPFLDVNPQSDNMEMPSFDLEIQVRNHPIISEVFLPRLKVFEKASLVADYDTEKQALKAHVLVRNIVYGTTDIKDLEAGLDSEINGLRFKISSLGISNPNVRMEHLLLEGTIADQVISSNLSSIDEKLNKKLQVRSVITRQQDGFRIAIDPEDFYLMNDRWDLSADNYLVLGKKGFYVHNFVLSKSDSKIDIASANDRFFDDLKIGIRNFSLDEISRIFATDTILLKGKADGNVLLKRVDQAYGIIADASIRNLVVRNVPVGDVSLKALNPESGKFAVEAKVTGQGNNLEAGGYFIPGGGDNSIRINASVQSLSMATVQAFSMGQVTEASGTLSGNFLVTGNSSEPDITGKLAFNDALFKPAALNSLLGISNQTIEITHEGINFRSFALTDKDKHVATIDGTILMKKFRDLRFDLKVDSRDFLLANTTAGDNREVHGRMIVDSRIDIQGPLNLPVINAKIKIKKGSNFTFAVPESRLTTDQGEGVVEFSNSQTINPILLRAEKKINQNSGFKGFDISSIIEVDQEATLRLLMDPASTDSLVVRGEAALSFTLDPSGKMSLTGAYNLNEGSYVVSLESVIKKKFNIVEGSTIIWNGDPLDADISINATYSVRASPYDLVYDQISGLSDADKGGYKNRYPFLVYLKLRGEILQPKISFDIQLAPEDKGILGGVVNQKLIMLNEDESALNKQVFALLVLGRFIQENPLLSESGGTSALVRSTVGKFLSAQLNQLSSKVVPGMEMNFDIQSYEDYQSGEATGRTQVEVGLKQQLFNERLSIEVGGTVDVEGEKARQNTASDITGDVTVEFKITKDGRFRLKAFRHNQYEGFIEGQLVETGAGILFLHDFNKWREMFIRQKKTKADLNPDQFP